MTEPPAEDWFDREGRIDAVVVEAMKNAATWSEGLTVAAQAAGVPEDEVIQVYDWASGALDDTPLFRFGTVHIAGSSWGLFVRELAGTAFLLSDADEPHTEYVWDWWTPPRDRSALEAAVRETWLAHWSDIPLPPAFGGAGYLWDGPKEERALAFRCLDELVMSDDRAWGSFTEQFDDVVRSLATLRVEGADFDALRESVPRPVHDLDWLARTVASDGLDVCREDDVSRRALVSYFLMS